VNADEVPFDERVEAIEEEDRPSTWEPEDLTRYLDGTHVPEEPTLMPRTDGACLLYPGRVHSFHGESESGKSMIAQAESARVLATGGAVAYLDFESDASVVVGRLLAMGATPHDIKERFHYIRPESDPDSNQTDGMAWRKLLGNRYDLAVIDGVTEAAAVYGVASKDNDEITRWIRSFARKLAQRTNAGVIQVDHVTKDPDSRGRFAIGGGAKMAALDGTAFIVEVKEPLGVGMRGLVVMRVAKDRPGQVRPKCGPFRASDRTQEAARVVVDSTVDGRIEVTVLPFVSSAEGPGGASGEKFRPTSVMEQVSRHIEGCREAQSENKIFQAVGGKESTKKTAITTLVEEGYLRVYVGARNAKLHEVVKRYRQTEDPQSDKYQPELVDEAASGWAEVEPPPEPPD
jgi:hypothetical protein